MFFLGYLRNGDVIRDFFLFIKFGKNIVENGEDVVCNVEFL